MGIKVTPQIQEAFATFRGGGELSIQQGMINESTGSVRFGYPTLFSRFKRAQR